jgi:hypothetical protein
MILVLRLVRTTPWRITRSEFMFLCTDMLIDMCIICVIANHFTYHL